MTMTDSAARYGKKRLARKMMRAIPYLGGLVAIITVGTAVRRKGLVRGVAHSALDAVPFVGSIKNAAEAVRGRDFFRDRDLPAVTR